MPEIPNRLRNLAVSDTGFVFDPATGNTFLLNETGVVVVRGLTRGLSREAVLADLLDSYEVGDDQAGRDLDDMLLQMRELGITA